MLGAHTPRECSAGSSSSRSKNGHGGDGRCRSLTVGHGVVVSAFGPRVDRIAGVWRVWPCRVVVCDAVMRGMTPIRMGRMAVARLDRAMRGGTGMRQARGALGIVPMIVDEAHAFIGSTFLSALGRSPSHQLMPSPSGFASLVAGLSSGSGVAPGAVVAMTRIVVFPLSYWRGPDVPAPEDFRSLARVAAGRLRICAWRAFGSGRPARLCGRDAARSDDSTVGLPWGARAARLRAVFLTVRAAVSP